MKIVSLIKLICFILIGINSYSLNRSASESFKKNRFRQNSDVNDGNISKNQEYESEEEAISNLEDYIKNLKHEIISKKPMYSKIILPTIDNNSNNSTIYIENFDENELNKKFTHSKSKIHSLINENLEDVKMRYFPTESKNLELNSNLRLIENQFNLKKQDLEKQKEQIQQISLKKDKELAETKSKTNFYKENTDKVLNKTMKIFNNINQIKMITDDYSNKYDSFKEDNEKMFERIKEFSRKDIKSLELKEELVLFLRDLQNTLNSTNSNQNSTNSNSKVTKSDKLVKELNLKNIIKKNFTEELLDLLLNIDLNDSKSLFDLLGKMDETSIKKISSLKENVSFLKLNDIKNFFVDSKKGINNRTIELIISNKKLKKQLEIARNKFKDNSDELNEVKKNNEGLQKVRDSYRKLLQEERDKSTFFTQKISILNNDFEKKMLRLNEIVKVEPKIQSVENKLKENLKETKKELENSSIDQLINNINEIVNQENLIFKTNKLKSIR